MASFTVVIACCLCAKTRSSYASQELIFHRARTSQYISATNYTVTYSTSISLRSVNIVESMSGLRGLRYGLRNLRPRDAYTSAKYALWATGITIFVNDNVAELTGIDGVSMQPTLSPTYHETARKDWVLWRKWNATSNVQRGDIVHFSNPVKPEAFAVKRVIALEGDTVYLDPKRRPRDPQSGEETSASRAWDAWAGKAVVPQGHVWVEGDNWRKTKDSNWYGPISKSLINGRALAILLPFERFWTVPWEGFKSRTRVGRGQAKDWRQGLPVELAEIGDPAEFLRPK